MRKALQPTTLQESANRLERFLSKRRVFGWRDLIYKRTKSRFTQKYIQIERNVFQIHINLNKIYQRDEVTEENGSRVLQSRRDVEKEDTGYGKRYLVQRTHKAVQQATKLQPNAEQKTTS